MGQWILSPRNQGLSNDGACNCSLAKLNWTDVTTYAATFTLMIPPSVIVSNRQMNVSIKSTVSTQTQPIPTHLASHQYSKHENQKKSKALSKMNFENYQ